MDSHSDSDEDTDSVAPVTHTLTDTHKHTHAHIHLKAIHKKCQVKCTKRFAIANVLGAPLEHNAREEQPEQHQLLPCEEASAIHFHTLSAPISIPVPVHV